MKDYTYDITYHGVHLNFMENQQWSDDESFVVIAEDNDGNEYFIHYAAADIEVGDESMINWEEPESVFTASGEEI